ERGIRPRRGRRMKPQPDARDDPERALAANQQRSEIETARPSTKAHRLPRAEDGLDEGHHVLDLSVAARALTCTARGDPAARGRTKNDRRGSTGGVAAHEARFLGLDAECARAPVERRPGADGPSAHPLRVDDDATRSTADTAANAATSAEGNERDPFAP